MNVEGQIAAEDRREEERAPWIEQERDADLINIRAPFNTLWRRKWVIVFTMLFSIGLPLLPSNRVIRPRSRWPTGTREDLSC